MRAVVIALILVFVSTSASASGQKPLVLDFIVDPDVRARFSSDDAFNEGMINIVSRASLIFNAEIGRRLEIGEIRIGTPNEAEEEFYMEQLLPWLKKEKRSRNFLVFIIGRTLRWGRDLESVPLDGAASIRDRLMVTIYYSTDIQHAVSIFLHELGHLCGAKHSEALPSIMSPTRNNSMSFGEQTQVIRENCR